MMFLGLPVLLSISYILYVSYSTYVNYSKASKLGLPLVVTPITPDNPLWIALQTAFGNVLHYFPFDTFSFTRHCRLGWEFHDRFKTHNRLGDAWILVTPAKNWLYIANAAAVVDMLGRGKDFTRPVWMLQMLNVFGPNVSTAEGHDWQRQRKLTAAPFNDAKNNLVWSESLHQADHMLKSWSTKSAGFTTTPDDTRTLALHVLAYVAFQKSYPFESTLISETRDDNSLTYRDSIAIILENALVIMVLPENTFSLSFMPLKWQRIGWAIKNFREHMSKQVEDELRLIQNGCPGSGTLVSNLVRASDESTNKRDSNAMLKPLTKAEILGNIFVFNFAGHDTTAISLGYAMLLLVAHPQVQNWVHEELQYYIGHVDFSTLDYNSTFPKLKRCLAVLLETLRLYNPLPGVPKYTGQKPTVLDINGQVYQIPEDMLVVPSLQAMHTLPYHWGNDSLVWRPQRWITGSGSLESERLFKPLKGTYFPWSEGIRNCPGKKFAQVEFVATLVVLLTNHVAEPATRTGESLEDARTRVLAVVKDSNVKLLLQMRDPRSVSVTWRERTR